MTQQPLEDQGLFIIEDSLSHSVGLPWTSDRTGAEVSTWQHTTLKRDINDPGIFEPATPAREQQ